MGLTNKSTGINASETKLVIKKQSRNDKVVAIAGNPNVGKSTVFNGLTGLHQHTGTGLVKQLLMLKAIVEEKKIHMF